MATITSCPSYEELDYYFQVQSLQSNTINPRLQSIFTHLKECSYCQNKLIEQENHLKEYATQTIEGNFFQPLEGYQFLKKIGQGATGEVYQAIKLSINRLVAVKMLKASDDDDFHPKRFQREATLLAQLDHPNIIHVFDYSISTDQKNYFLIMQFIEGENLEDYLQRKKSLSVEEALILWIQLLEGFATLHDAWIIHRDVKPANILIDTQGALKIIDLGLAKPQIFDGNLTLKPSLLGTPLYMSPEACLCQPQANQSDIYSLGAVFYFTLAGKPPFTGSSLSEIFSKNLSMTPPPLSLHRTDIPPEIEKIVQKMMEKSCDLRYSSCSEILKDLIPFILVQKIDIPQQIKFSRYPSSYFQNTLEKFLESGATTSFSSLRSNVSSKKSTTKRIPFLKTPQVEEERAFVLDPYSKVTSPSTPLNTAATLKLPSPSFTATLHSHFMEPSPLLQESAELFSFTSQTEVCRRCHQSRFLFQFFKCDSCQTLLCFTHLKGLLCHFCFEQHSHSHRYYKTIRDQIHLAESPKNQLTPKGSINCKTLAQIFSSFKSVSYGLLMVGNTEEKRGIYFFDTALILIHFNLKDFSKFEKILFQSSQRTEKKLRNEIEHPKKATSRLLLKEKLETTSTICQETFQEVLVPQMVKNILEITQWNSGEYKIKEGTLPQELLQSISLDFRVTLENPTLFKANLSALFTHLQYAILPGVFIFTAGNEYVGCCIEKSHIQLFLIASKINASEPSPPLRPKEPLPSTGDRPKTTKLLPKKTALEKAGPTAIKTFREFFLQFSNIPEKAQQHKWFLSLFGELLFTSLHPTKFQCFFLEKNIFSAHFTQVPKTIFEIHSSDFLYSLLGRLYPIEPPLPSTELFSLLFAQPSVSQMRKMIYARLYYYLQSYTASLASFTPFEAAFLYLFFAKSYLIHCLDSLKQQSQILAANHHHSESHLLLQCVSEISKADPFF